MRSHRSSVLTATLLRVIEAAPTPTTDMIADHVPPETGSAIVEVDGAAVQTVALLRAPHR
jgi:hypothetical protein